ncbi:MAG: aminoacyl-tRNA hydrolase [candidate division Zixibacteria bacterium]|nr:aminoacyl-tRNA hydrolase [candidate division Zixibacteria bacterium]
MILLVVGLGNIGEKYRHTRHNVGFNVLNAISQHWKLTPRAGRGDFYLLEKELNRKMVRLIWPTTNMNNSGIAVAQAAEQFEVVPEDILIVCDEYQLPLGILRFRKGGSDGGHNGLASVIEQMETDAIPRLRLGIGPLPPDTDAVSFVLSCFAEDERKITQKVLEKGASAVLYSLNKSLEEAMTLYNRNPAPDNA